MKTFPRIYRPDDDAAWGDGECDLSHDLPAARRTFRTWLYALAVDMLALALIVTLCTGAVRGECHVDPTTGLEVCTVNDGTVDGPGATRRVTAVDHETQLPPGASQILDSGTCSLIYDDGTRAIVLTCWHNLRNTGPPYRIQVGDGWREAKVIDQDPEDELVALEIAGGTGITPVGIYDGALPLDVTGCGYGGRDEGYRFASVAGKVTSTQYDHPGFRGFSGQVRQGDSGGPVLTTDGRIVGVLWGNQLENREVMFTCEQPLRRFLDRILPGRPGCIIPHATTGTPIRLPRPSLPPSMSSSPPIPRPSSIVDAPPARTPPSLPSPAIPPLDLTPAPSPATPAATPAPPYVAPQPAPPAVMPPADPPTVYPEPAADDSPGVYIPPAIDAAVNKVGTSAIMKLLITLGLGGGVAGLVAIPAWMLIKYGAKREAKKIADHFKARETTKASSADGADADPSEETFHFTSSTNSSEQIERDTSEAEQLLRLRRLEGRDPLQDSLRGAVIGDILETLAEGSGDPNRAQFARDLQHQLDRRFNEIVPTKLKVNV